MAAISSADRHDSRGGALLRASRRLWPFPAHCFADRAHQGKRIGAATAIIVEIVVPAEGQKGFAVQLQRRVIERNRWVDRPLL